MPASSTPRHQLPYLAVGQAQKEITHNEALVRIDALLQPLVEAELSIAPVIPAGAQAGKCWLVGAAPSVEWAGKYKQIACWDGYGWQFIVPTEMMRIRNKTLSADMVFTGTSWTPPTPLADVSGGNVVDIEVRNTLNQLLIRLRNAGMILS
jgi:Protein of unknown function (DUF2793)